MQDATYWKQDARYWKYCSNCGAVLKHEKAENVFNRQTGKIQWTLVHVFCRTKAKGCDYQIYTIRPDESVGPQEVPF